MATRCPCRAGYGRLNHIKARIGWGKPALQLYTGQRTKDCRKLADAICIDCTYVGLTARGVTLGEGPSIEGAKIDPSLLGSTDDFARADGFEDYAAMWAWFSERYGMHSFIDYVIR